MQETARGRPRAKAWQDPWTGDEWEVRISEKWDNSSRMDHQHTYNALIDPLCPYTHTRRFQRFAMNRGLYDHRSSKPSWVDVLENDEYVHGNVETTVPVEKVDTDCTVTRQPSPKKHMQRSSSTSGSEPLFTDSPPKDGRPHSAASRLSRPPSLRASFFEDRHASPQSASGNATLPFSPMMTKPTDTKRSDLAGVSLYVVDGSGDGVGQVAAGSERLAKIRLPASARLPQLRARINRMFPVLKRRFLFAWADGVHIDSSQEDRIPVTTLHGRIGLLMSRQAQSLIPQAILDSLDRKAEKEERARVRAEQKARERALEDSKRRALQEHLLKREQALEALQQNDNVRSSGLRSPPSVGIGHGFATASPTRTRARARTTSAASLPYSSTSKSPATAPSPAASGAAKPHRPVASQSIPTASPARHSPPRSRSNSPTPASSPAKNPTSTSPTKSSSHLRDRLEQARTRARTEHTSVPKRPLASSPSTHKNMRQREGAFPSPKTKPLRKPVAAVDTEGSSFPTKRKPPRSSSTTFSDPTTEVRIQWPKSMTKSPASRDRRPSPKPARATRTTTPTAAPSGIGNKSTTVQGRQPHAGMSRSRSRSHPRAKQMSKETIIRAVVRGTVKYWVEEATRAIRVRSVRKRQAQRRLVY